ncbi:MAG: alpha/beta fold hydrolase [Pseudomonadota bacterium]
MSTQIRYAMLGFMVAAVGAFFFAVGAAYACSTTTPCAVDQGEYFIAFPDETDSESTAENAEAMPAILFIHGFGGSGETVFRNTGMVDQFLARGYAVVAPNGVPRANGNGRSWGFHPRFQGNRDEVAFIQSVRDDMIARHGIDAETILLTGFSIGGSMATYLACAAPDSFAAYAPIGGSFWRPHPTGCDGDVRLLHTHGWTDGTVPLEGRLLRGSDVNEVGALAQGDVFHAMEIWRVTNDCIHLKADSFVTEGFFWRRKWERCLPGSALELALFPGGHVIPTEWPALAMDWFEGL